MSFAEVMLRVVPITLVGALSPFNITVVLLMLTSQKHPLARASAFVTGFITCLVILGSIAVGILSTLHAPSLRPAGHMFIAAMGIILILLGIRQILSGVDPDEPPKKWMEHLAEFSPFTAFLVGIGVSAVGLKTLSIYAAALGIILTADLNVVSTLVSIGIAILVLCSTMLLPILVYAVTRDRSAALMNQTCQWLQNQQARVTGTILLLIGGVLIWFGLQIFI